MRGQRRTERRFSHEHSSGSRPVLRPVLKQVPDTKGFCKQVPGTGSGRAGGTRRRGAGPGRSPRPQQEGEGGHCSRTRTAPAPSKPLKPPLCTVLHEPPGRPLLPWDGVELRGGNRGVCPGAARHGASRRSELAQFASFALFFSFAPTWEQRSGLPRMRSARPAAAARRRAARLPGVTAFPLGLLGLVGGAWTPGATSLAF